VIEKCFFDRKNFSLSSSRLKNLSAFVLLSRLLFHNHFSLEENNSTNTPTQQAFLFFSFSVATDLLLTKRVFNILKIYLNFVWDWKMY